MCGELTGRQKLAKGSVNTRAARICAFLRIYFEGCLFDTGLASGFWSLALSTGIASTADD